MLSLNLKSIKSLSAAASLAANVSFGGKLWEGFSAYAIPVMEEATLMIRGIIAVIPKQEQEVITEMLKSLNKFLPLVQKGHASLSKLDETDELEEVGIHTLAFFAAFLEAIELLEAVEEHQMLKSGQRILAKRNFSRIKDRL